MMTNISKYHSVKVISAVMGFIVLSELAVAQDMGKNDSVSVRTEKTDMPYKVKGRIIDAVTKKGFAGARVTTPNLNVSAMTDENGKMCIRDRPRPYVLFVILLWCGRLMMSRM